MPRLLALMLASESSEMVMAGDIVAHDTRGVLSLSPREWIEASSGTRLTCHLSERFTWPTIDALREDLEWASAGSPLPVIFNGEVISRPAALSEGKHEQGLYAAYQFLEGGSGQFKLFLEGLPVTIPSASFHGLVGAAGSIHLNPDEFSTPFPGCGLGVCDPMTANLLVHEEGHHLRKLLAKKAANMDASAFVLEHTADCLALGEDRLIEGLPLHPMFWGRYSALPSPVTLPAQSGSQALLSTTPHLVDDVLWEYGEMMSLVACYIYSLGWPVLTGRIPSSHWAARQALSPAEVSLRITDHELIDKRVITEGLLCGVTVRVCERFTLATNHSRAPTVESFEAPAFCDDTMALYLTPGSEKHLYPLLSQLDRYARDPRGVAKLQLHRDHLSLRQVLAETLAWTKSPLLETVETN